MKTEWHKVGSAFYLWNTNSDMTKDEPIAGMIFKRWIINLSDYHDKLYS